MPMTPIFGQKCDREGQKPPTNIFCPLLSKGQLNLWAKYSEPKKMDLKKVCFSMLQELDVRICVQPNFPIIILSLLTGFHKFAKSMWPNTNGLWKSGCIQAGGIWSLVGHQTWVAVARQGSNLSWPTPYPVRVTYYGNSYNCCTTSQYEDCLVN